MSIWFEICRRWYDKSQIYEYIYQKTLGKAKNLVIDKYFWLTVNVLVLFLVETKFRINQFFSFTKFYSHDIYRYSLL